MAAKDYCTLFPDGIPGTKYQWGDCCKEHDEYFGSGKVTYFQANLYLWHCVRRKGKTYEAVANIMWIGTTLLGWPFWLQHKD